MFKNQIIKYVSIAVSFIVSNIALFILAIPALMAFHKINKYFYKNGMWGEGIYTFLELITLFGPLLFTIYWFYKISSSKIKNIVEKELSENGETIEIRGEGNNELEKNIVRAAKEAKEALGYDKDVALYIIKENEFNAFAISNIKKESAIVVYEGLAMNTNYEQLKSIIGHELGHIINKDSLNKLLYFATQSTMSLVIRICDGLMAMAQNLTSSIPFVGIFVLIYRLAYQITVGIVNIAIKLNSLLQIYSYKQAEYIADLNGAKATSNATMINALELIKSIEASSGSHKRTALASLLAEHPSTDNRIKNLKMGE